MKRLLLASTLLALPVTASAETGPCGAFEAIEPGDTFATIAERCEVPVDLIAALNPEVDPAKMAIGAVLQLTTTSPEGGAAAAATTPAPESAPAPASAPAPTPAPPAPVETAAKPRERPSPAARWTSAFIGGYAADAACPAGPEWTLADETIEGAGRICTISEFAILGDRLMVDAPECKAGGEAVPGVVLGFQLDDEGVLTISGTQLFETVRRCGS